MKILRKEEELTPEMLEKIKEYVSKLKYNDYVRADFMFAENKKIQAVQTIDNILKFGVAVDMPVIRFGELFICDSKHANCDLCICKLVKGKKQHIVLHKILDNIDYKNFCSGYFAIPYL